MIVIGLVGHFIVPTFQPEDRPTDRRDHCQGRFHMRTIAIINQKGGCGKTTTSINLAACLARLGHKTLLVDMDPQGHCGVGLAVPEDQIERTIYEALIEERDGKPARVSDIVWQIASDFDLAPSNIRLAAFEQVFAGRPGRDDRLKRALESLRNTYQWAIIDCPPSVGLLTFNALRACDEVIVPVETGFFSLHGLTKMMETLEVMRHRCGKEILIRVLPTLYDTRTKLAREVLSELRNKFREYLMESTVNFNTKLKEAASFGQPITEYDPGSRGYKDFVNLARELMGHRPTETEPTPSEHLSRPAELVQRAKQLTQLANYQFGRHNLGSNSVPVSQPEPVPAQVVAISGGRLALSGQPAPRIEPVAAPAFPKLVTTDSSSAMIDLDAPLPIDSTIRYTDPSRHAMLSMSDLTLNMGGLTNNSFGSAIPASANMVITLPDLEPVKTTQQKIDEFYGVKQIGGEVLFAARFDNARNVQIAGDFNNWQPASTPMTAGKPGDWKTRLALRPGRYRYRLVVDGRWTTDPANTYVESNQFGELNNIVEVD
jgi:chromosome partitioning protein